MHLTCIKLPFVINLCFVFLFEWLFYTGFTVLAKTLIKTFSFLLTQSNHNFWALNIFLKHFLTKILAIWYDEQLIISTANTKDPDQTTYLGLHYMSMHFYS